VTADAPLQAAATGEALRAGAEAGRGRQWPTAVETAAWVTGGLIVAWTAWRLLSAIPMSHDVAFFYYASGRLLDGAKLYRDIVEINPPLVYLLGVPPAWLARTLGLPPIPVFFAACMALVAASLVLTWRVMRATAAFSSAAMQRLGLLALACIELVLVVGYGMFNQFGQREHIALVLIVPYVVAAGAAAAGRGVGRRLGAVVGALAGVAVAFKPFFLVPWALLEVYVGFRARSWRRVTRVESVVAGVTQVALFLVFVTLEPGFLANARLNLAVRPGLTGPFSALLLRWEVVVWAAAGLALLALRVRPADDDVGAAVFIAASGFLVAAVVQRHGMDYHYYPMLALSSFVLVVRSARWLGSRVRGRSETARRLVAASIGAVLLGAALVAGARLPRTMQRPEVAELAGVIAEHARGGSVYQLASTVDPLFPAINEAGGRWLGHFNHLGPWLSTYLMRDPALPRYNTPEEMGRAERMAFRTVLDDLRRYPPALLVVETSYCKLRLPCGRFDFLEYYGQAKQFRELMDRYEFLRTLAAGGGFTYAVYLRAR
jgi:hypothetical protein